MKLMKKEENIENEIFSSVFMMEMFSSNICF